MIDCTRSSGVAPRSLARHLTAEGEWNRNMFYTNFEISRLDFWKSDGYTAYFSHIDKQMGIYMHRWGRCAGPLFSHADSTLWLMLRVNEWDALIHVFTLCPISLLSDFVSRWGDAPIHLLAVSLLLDESQIERFDDVPYWHQYYVNMPAIPVVAGRPTNEL